MEWYIAGAIIVSVLFFMMAMGLPVAFCLFAISILGLTIAVGPSSALYFLGDTIFWKGISNMLIVVPLFIFMGALFSQSGVGAAIYEAIRNWLAFLPGSMAVGSVGACAVFGAMCGSTTATTATIGTIGTPTMLKYDYDKRLATGVVAAAGALAPIIPPSVYMIVYAVAAEESVGKLFLAALMPGLILAIVMMVQIVVMVLINPKIAPSAAETSWREKIAGLKILWVPILIIFLVLGTIYLGLATPGEAAAAGAFGALVTSVATGRLNWRGFQAAVVETLVLSCMVMFLIISGSLFSKLLAVYLIPHHIAGWVAGLGLPLWSTMLLMQFVIFIGGVFIEGCALIIILMPVFLPILKAMEFSLIVFGVAFMVNLAMAVITPPFAPNLFVMQGVVPEVDFIDIALGALRFLIAEVIVLALALIFPMLSLWLPLRMK